MARRAHFCEKWLCRAGEGAGSAATCCSGGQRCSRHTWLSNWLHKYQYTEDLGMQTAQLWFVPPTEPIPSNPPLPRLLFQRWHSPKPSLAKKSLKLAGASLKSLLHSWIPISSCKCLMCCERFIGSFPGATYTGSCPSLLAAALGKWAWKLRRTIPGSQCSHNRVSCALNRGRWTSMWAEWENNIKLQGNPIFNFFFF